MRRDLLLITLTPEQILGLLDHPDSPNGLSAREKLEAWRPDEYASSLWVRVGQIWRRPNEREFLIVKITGSLKVPKVKTKPLSEGGRPSVSNVLTLSLGIPDPRIAPRLISTSPGAEWVLTVRDLSRPTKKMEHLVETCGHHLWGVRPGDGCVQFELTEADEQLLGRLLDMKELDPVLTQRC